MKKHLIIVVFLCVVYLGCLFIYNRDIFSFKISQTLVASYLHSQDITYDVPGRVFLSDSDIHIASSYLYMAGNEPTYFNFQHPPFIKYLFGFSMLLTGNPFWIQMGFGIALLLLTYIISWKLFRSHLVSALAMGFLATDRLFLDISSQALLDLGQTTLLIAYITLVVFYPKKYVLQGIALGFAAASKFWMPVVTVTSIIAIYEFIQKKNAKDLLVGWLKRFAVAGIIFCSVYAATFIQYAGRGELFNIVFFQLRMLRYWFQHSVSAFPGANAFLFLTGYFKQWYGESVWEHVAVWSLLWPLGFAYAGFETFQTGKKIVKSGIKKMASYKKFINEKTVIMVFPLIFLASLSIQAPFARYFIMVLPFFYVLLAAGMVKARMFFLKGKSGEVL